MTDLIKYLPDVVADTKEFIYITDAENPIIDDLWGAVNLLLNESFVLTAENAGLERMEKMLGLGIIDDTVVNRRIKILAMLNGEPPYTYKRLCEKLKELCGEDSVYIDYDRGIFLLTVKLDLSVKNLLSIIKGLLKLMVPSNIILDCDLLYNTHVLLKQFTHGGLQQFTHKHLYEEVLI